MEKLTLKNRRWRIRRRILVDAVVYPAKESLGELRVFAMIYLLCCHKSQTALFLGFLERQMGNSWLVRMVFKEQCVWSFCYGLWLSLFWRIVIREDSIFPSSYLSCLVIKSIRHIKKKKKKKEKKKKEVKLMWKEERGRWVNFHQSHFFHFHFLLDYKIHHQNHPLTKKTPLFKISHIPPPPSPSPQKSLNQTGCKRKIYL